MDEAYAQLYQEFLRLRSLCLKQASLLQQLSTALQQKQGATNGDLSGMTSLPAQYTSEIPVNLNSTPQPPPTLSPAAPCGVQGPSGNMGTFSDLLAEDMSKLCMETPGASCRKGSKSELSVPHSLTSNMTLSYGAAHSVINADLNSAHATLSGAGCPTHCGDLQTQSNGMMMTMMNSDVVLQSNVCEFCHAVFPGDTTTRGEYLRHLYTHIT